MGVKLKDKDGIDIELSHLVFYNNVVWRIVGISSSGKIQLKNSKGFIEGNIQDLDVQGLGPDYISSSHVYDWSNHDDDEFVKARKRRSKSMVSINNDRLKDRYDGNCWWDTSLTYKKPEKVDTIDVASMISDEARKLNRDSSKKRSKSKEKTEEKQPDNVEAKPLKKRTPKEW